MTTLKADRGCHFVTRSFQYSFTMDLPGSFPLILNHWTLFICLKNIQKEYSRSWTEMSGDFLFIWGWFDMIMGHFLLRGHFQFIKG